MWRLHTVVNAQDPALKENKMSLTPNFSFHEPASRDPRAPFYLLGFCTIFITRCATIRCSLYRLIIPLPPSGCCQKASQMFQRRFFQPRNLSLGDADLFRYFHLSPSVKKSHGQDQFLPFTQPFHPFFDSVFGDPLLSMVLS